MISCAGVTGSVGITCHDQLPGVTGSVGITRHACIAQIAGLNPQSSRAPGTVAEDCCIMSCALLPGLYIFCGVGDCFSCCQTSSKSSQTG